MKPFSRFIAVCALVGVVLISSHATHAGSATWRSNASTGLWDSTRNWSPATVPNGPDDIASFAATSLAYVFPYSDTEVNSIVFNSTASAYLITIANNFTSGTPPILVISGTGIINNSGITQNFLARRGSSLIFANNATPGEQTVFSNWGGEPTWATGGTTMFRDTSNAGSAPFTANGAPVWGAIGSFIRFTDDSSAANGAFVANGLAFDYDSGQGVIRFEGNATAANGVFTMNGGTATSAQGGQLDFKGGTADHATLIANGGSNGGLGGLISFTGGSRGGKARVRLYDNGTLDISGLGSRELTIGSIEGTGKVLLGSKNLTVGSSDLSTRFSGLINGAGSLIKVGSGKLLLNGINAYTGGTTINGGELELNNTTGSATGTGTVKANRGTLSGAGRIDGAVTIGTATGIKAVLSPGALASNLWTMKIRNSLTFNSDGTYQCGLNSDSLSADKLIVHGVTINGGILKVTDFGGAILTPSTSFTVISNNDVAAISGAFSNLPDGGTITVGNNTFQANYEGGDGNDLTLTVVP